MRGVSVLLPLILAFAFVDLSLGKSVSTQSAQESTGLTVDDPSRARKDQEAMAVAANQPQ